MISYEPLYKTLKEKGISVNQNPIDFVLNEGIKE